MHDQTSQPAPGAATRTCQALLSAPLHIDDAVDHLVDALGWDEAFQELASLPGERARIGLYSLVCGLVISHG